MSLTNSDDSLSKYLQSRSTQFKSLSHGLWIDEPLTIEGVVKSCFLNPKRKDFPDFVRKMGWVNLPISKEYSCPDSFLKMIDPKLIADFNSKSI